MTTLEELEFNDNKSECSTETSINKICPFTKIGDKIILYYKENTDNFLMNLLECNMGTDYDLIFEWWSNDVNCRKLREFWIQDEDLFNYITTTGIEIIFESWKDRILNSNCFIRNEITKLCNYTGLININGRYIPNSNDLYYIKKENNEIIFGLLICVVNNEKKRYYELSHGQNINNLYYNDVVYINASLHSCSNTEKYYINNHAHRKYINKLYLDEYYKLLNEFEIKNNKLRSVLINWPSPEINDNCRMKISIFDFYANTYETFITKFIELTGHNIELHNKIESNNVINNIIKLIKMFDFNSNMVIYAKNENVIKGSTIYCYNKCYLCSDVLNNIYCDHDLELNVNRQGVVYYVSPYSEFEHNVKFGLNYLNGSYMDDIDIFYSMYNHLKVK
jgi:hypothetical protein